MMLPMGTPGERHVGTQWRMLNILETHRGENAVSLQASKFPAGTSVTREKQTGSHKSLAPAFHI